MDVAGVALATVISQCISGFLVVRCLLRETGAIRLDLRRLKIYGPKLRQILRVGLPAGFQGILFSLSNVVIQASVNTFGETIMAGNSAASNIENFIYVALNAFYQANVSFTSQNMGAGNYRRIWQILLRVELCVITLGLVLGGLGRFFGPQLLGLYSPSPAVIEAGMVRLRIVCFTYALCGIMDSLVGTLRGIGYSVLPMVVTLVGACGTRLLWISTVFQLPAFHTVETVYWSYPISWVLTAAIHTICVVVTMRRLKRQLTITEPSAH
jgi:Na+-driven multidrug efflux pump